MAKKQITPRGRKSNPTSGTSRATSSTRKTSSTASKRTSSARQNSGGTTPRKTIKKAPEPEPKELPPFIKRVLEDPDALRDLGKFVPSWADELIAVLLIGSGAVAFASLLSAGGEGEVSQTVADALRQGFGSGSYLVALVILALGLIILLPKIGIKIRFSWSKIIALELAFVALQGLFHILPFEPESYDLARDGKGGGYVGWGISSLVNQVLSEPLNWLLLGTILVISLHLILGIGRHHYRMIGHGISGLILSLATRLDPEPKSTAPFYEDAFDDSAPDYSYGEVHTEEDYDPLPIPMAKRRVPINPSRAGRPSVVPRESVTGRTEAPPEPSYTPPPQPPTSAPVSSAAASIPMPRTTARAIDPETVPEDDIPAADDAIEDDGWIPPVINSASTRRQNGSSRRNGSTPRISISSRRNGSSASSRRASSRRRSIVGASTGGSDRSVLVINGQTVNASPLNSERQSVVPRQEEEAEQPKPAVLGRNKRNYKGGRDNDPSKRYFTVADFFERKKIGKRNDELPPLELLSDYDLYKPDEDEINLNASIIENTLIEFDIDADVIDVKVGPVVTQYAVSPIKEVLDPETKEVYINRVRVDKITNLQGDLSLALSAKTLRIEAPVPGHSYVGIEVPNRQPSTVGLRPVMESERFYNKRNNPLVVPLGRDVSGEAVMLELATLPHLLIAGTTGSGKSVCLTSVVTSLVMTYMPDELQLIMLDPKRVELTRFNGLPHLIGPVETDAERIVGVLRWTAREMDRRYKLMELENARNISVYNANLGRRRKDEQLPYMVLVFDEIGDLMMTHPDETEATITRLAQKARAAGIHLVVATQRPSTDVLTGLIKANFPGRLSFAVASGVDSRVILDYTGAETLLGRGDMLYLAPDAAGPKRVQGCFISDDELEEVVMYWRNWHAEKIAEGEMDAPGVAPWERGLTRIEAMSEHDPMIEEAIKVVCDAGEASTSLIQRRLGIGYPRAARLMDSLHELGVIGPPKAGGRARDVRVNSYKQALKHMSKNRNR